jgi:hypothetical protein
LRESATCSDRRRAEQALELAGAHLSWPEDMRAIVAGFTGAPITHQNSVEDCEAPPQLYATRVVGREVWKAEALLTEGGDSIGYVQRRRRVSLGLAMGTVKDDDTVLGK